VKVLLLNPVMRDGTRSLRVARCQGRVIVGLWPNLEHGILAALLEADGFDASLLDANHQGLGFDDMLRRAASLAPDVVVLLSITAAIDDDLHAARRLRAMLPAVRVIFWGTHATARPDDYLGQPGLDGVLLARREPDLTVRDLCRALRDGARDFANVAGASWDDRGTPRHAPERAFVADLDTLPMPSHGHMGTGGHLATDSGRPFALIKTSRGCPADCVFCTTRTMHGARWRPRSPAAIVDEVRHVLRTTPVRDFFLQSDVFSRDRAWTADLCERLLASDLGVTWFCNSRVDTVDEDLLRLMRRSGCRLIALGVESGSDRVLRAVRKGADAATGAATLAACRRVGLPTLTYWVFGLPGETPATIRETLDYVDRTDPDYAHFYAPTPLPGSRLFDDWGIAGMVDRGEVRWPDFFQGVNDGRFLAPTVTRADVDHALREAWLRFYTRPRRLFREVRRLRDPRQLVGRLATLRNMVANYAIPKR
jgi:radical SAM superfamily enzyme YgiQ (UPF0313 family)